MNSGLVYLRPARLAYVRVTGPYVTSIPEAWSRLLTWLDSNGQSSPAGIGYGLARDNPLTTPPEKCRYDACVPVTPHLEEKAMRELGIATLPPGSYKRLRHTGGYEPIRAMMTSIYSEFTPPPQLRFDERRPIVSIYLDDPRRIDAADLKADICVPVAAVRPARDVA